MCDPILVTIENDSQSSRENVTQSSGTSPLASEKEVFPPPHPTPPGMHADTTIFFMFKIFFPIN